MTVRKYEMKLTQNFEVGCRPQVLQPIHHLPVPRSNPPVYFHPPPLQLTFHHLTTPSPIRLSLQTTQQLCLHLTPPQLASPLLNQRPIIFLPPSLAHYPQPTPPTLPFQFLKQPFPRHLHSSPHQGRAVQNISVLQKY